MKQIITIQDRQETLIAPTVSGDQRRPDPEVWEQAQHRKGRRIDHQVGGNNKVISKFFVSNLPPKCSSQDLKEVLGGYGSFEGSYIARKVDKWGKRFSFVSFSGVKDIKRMEEELSDVWIGSYKLFITIARFVDGEKVSKSDSNPIRKTKVTYQKSHANHNSGAAYEGGGSPVLNGSNYAAVGHGRSYVDSVMNRNKVDIIRVDDVVERFFEWNGYAFVGRVVDFNTLGSLKQVLRKNGCSSVDIKYLGGLTVVVVFHESGEAERFINDNSTWSVWFTSLAPWDGNASMEEERIAWIQVHGVPVQLALDQVFDSIGSRYGKVVHSANMSGDDNNFSYALIGVLTKVCKRIVDRVDISWRGKLFNVWVDEEVGEWIPDCVLDDEEDGTSETPQEERVDDLVHQDENMSVHCEEGEVRRDVGSGNVDNDGVGNSHGITSRAGGVHGLAEPSGRQTVSSTGGKKFRRKSLFNNRSEGSGSIERPKKRPRENNDLFGLDKLIGIISEASESGGSGEAAGNDCFLTPDLNQRVTAGGSG
ncbi:putative RNA recognition motif domain, nucleotide-binding alpha-beta plait domain superfamily [Helianthus annuus]|nr:putative RNA recognition motif domain, nucleotide-binding alpha-beta plait domain superfamily [Helianthus annuus]KAJ0516367.1 putative RNA recognition motif domain, nucleotide-binding alpha-beta plait domain superfamily [Helianthus annuus]